MGLELILGIGAFVVLGVMIFLLWESSRWDDTHDEITREIIIRAETGEVRTQEKRN